MDGIRLEHIYKSYTTLSTDVILDHAERPATTRTVLKDLSLTIPAVRAKSGPLPLLPPLSRRKAP